MSDHTPYNSATATEGVGAETIRAEQIAGWRTEIRSMLNRCLDELRTIAADLDTAQNAPGTDVAAAPTPTIELDADNGRTQILDSWDEAPAVAKNPVESARARADSDSHWNSDSGFDAEEAEPPIAKRPSTDAPAWNPTEPTDGFDTIDCPTLPCGNITDTTAEEFDDANRPATPASPTSSAKFPSDGTPSGKSDSTPQPTNPPRPPAADLPPVPVESSKPEEPSKPAERAKPVEFSTPVTPLKFAETPKPPAEKPRTSSPLPMSLTPPPVVVKKKDATSPPEPSAFDAIDSVTVPYGGDGGASAAPKESFGSEFTPTSAPPTSRPDAFSSAKPADGDKSDRGGEGDGAGESESDFDARLARLKRMLAEKLGSKDK